MAPSGFQLTAFSLVLSNPTELNARGDAEGGGGGLQCEASGPCP
jgi:hypothetical protein